MEGREVKNGKNEGEGEANDDGEGWRIEKNTGTREVKKGEEVKEGEKTKGRHRDEK